MSHQSNLVCDLDEVARVYAKDPDLVLRRRFERLHHLNLFYKHKRLVDLNESVADLEIFQSTVSTNKAQEGDELKEAPKVDRLLKEIGDALEDFDKASLIYQRSVSAARATPPLLKRIQEITEKKASRYHDHYTIGSGWEESGFHIAPEKNILYKVIASAPILQKFFTKKEAKDEEKNDTSSPTDIDLPVYCTEKVRHLIDLVVNISFCMTVLIPTMALSYVKSQTIKLIILGVSVLCAAAVSTTLASALHKPSLGIIAAYTAILVVFLNNNDCKTKPDSM